MRNVNAFLGGLLAVVLLALSLESVQAATFAPSQTGYGGYTDNLVGACETYLKPKISDQSKYSDCVAERTTDFNPSTWRWSGGLNQNVFTTAEWRITAYCIGCSNWSTYYYEIDPSHDPAANCSVDQTYNYDTQACEDNPSGPVCEEQGLFFDGETGFCVTQCPSGQSLDAFCLAGAPVGEPNLDEGGATCDPGDQDYVGVFEGKHYCDGDLPEPATCPSGQMAWVVTDSSGSGAYVCGEPIKDPSEAGETQTENTTTETVGDETITTTTDDNGNTVTTVTNNVTGDSSTSITYPGVDAETGQPCSASSVSCLPTPETQKGICEDGGSLCEDVNSIKKALEKTSDRTTKTGAFEVAEANTAVATAEAELSAGLDAIKAEIGGYFDLALTAGDMVCGPGVEVLGRTIQICPSTMKEELAVVAQIVLLMAGLISLMIIFR